MQEYGIFSLVNIRLISLLSSSFLRLQTHVKNRKRFAGGVGGFPARDLETPALIKSECLRILFIDIDLTHPLGIGGITEQACPVAPAFGGRMDEKHLYHGVAQCQKPAKCILFVRDTEHGQMRQIFSRNLCPEKSDVLFRKKVMPVAYGGFPDR